MLSACFINGAFVVSSRSQTGTIEQLPNGEFVELRIGYPCINRTIECGSNKTFRLNYYNEYRLKETVRNNLDCLHRILQFNLDHNLLFFRITSDLIPFASHPINTFGWQEFFRSDFEMIGDLVLENQMRISMHPDQFTLINSIREDVFERSLLELNYHAEVLDLMKLDPSAKIQIHVGGAYGNKRESIERFVSRYHLLGNSIRRRLVIENDDKLFNVNDCLEISARTQIPVLFDFFHHILNKASAAGSNSLKLTARTWTDIDGPPMVDYSSRKHGGKRTQHADTIDLEDFACFLKSTEPCDIDVMLEIKDKEVSAMKAIKLAENDFRFRAFLRGKT